MVEGLASGQVLPEAPTVHLNHFSGGVEFSGSPQKVSQSVGKLQLLRKGIFHFCYIYLPCVSVCAYVCACIHLYLCPEVRGQFAGVGSLFLPSGSRASHSGHQPGQQEHLPAGPSCQPRKGFSIDTWWRNRHPCTLIKGQSYTWRVFWSPLIVERI